MGKVRLLLFWASRDDVGGARLTWQASEGRSAIALLAGSNPDRAPNGLNQWAYVREEVGRDAGEVFAARSVTDAESAPDPSRAVLDGPHVAVSCASVAGSSVRTATTTITTGRGVTYRKFGSVLDHLALSPPWKEKQLHLPPGAQIGFLTALRRLMSEPRDEAAPAARRSISYLYNNAVYDLALVRTTTLGPETIGSRTFERLSRQ